jgi:hypothetical protein
MDREDYSKILKNIQPVGSISDQHNFSVIFFLPYPTKLSARL